MTLFYACAEGHSDIVQLLIAKGHCVNKPNENGVSPLGIASQNGQIDIVRLLLDNKADINSKDKYNSSGLIKALINGHQETAEYLIKHGADVNLHNDLGYSPLLLACENGFIRLVELLITSGAQLKSNRDPLYVACVHGNYEIAKLLVEHGTDLNISSRFGGTPLFCSCRKGYMNIVRLLIENGANIHQLFENKTCLSVAYESGHYKVFDYLSCHLINELHELYQYNHIEMFRQQIVHSIDAEADYPIKPSHVQLFQLMNPKKSPIIELEGGMLFKYFFTFDFKEKLLEDFVKNLKEERELMHMCHMKVNKEKIEFEKTIKNWDSNERPRVHELVNMKQLKYIELRELIDNESLIHFLYTDKSVNSEKLNRLIYLNREIQRFIKRIDSKIKISNELYDELNSVKLIEFRKRFYFI